ncbi:MAG: GTPase HflX, partial [Dysgonamonadaceae bacterium]|nr:GTPase HflX [Dysgonamonadaceae bacterium]
MKDFIQSEQKSTRAILVGLITPEQSEEKVAEYLDELDFLADTAGLVSVKRFVQRLDKANPLTFVGTGKLQEIKNFVADEDNDV